jgi:MFS family permease
MLVIAVFDSPWVVWPYLILLGIDVGIAYTAVSAMWAELYGVGHLGAIKSLASALSVFASALGPVVMGALMDHGLRIETVCVLFAVYALFALGASLAALRKLRSR